MIDKIFVIDGEAENAAEAIRLTGGKLFSEGYVKDTFVNACLEREKKYPTGLPTEIGCAIPHCDAVNVVKPAVCVLRLKNPVVFEDMGGEDPVACEFVMNLALHKQEQQVDLLQRILGIVQDRELLERIKGSSADDAAKMLEERLNTADE